MKDYYKILEVSKDVTDDELKKAYRRLSMKYHPDRQGGKSDAEKKEAEEKFKEIAEAYSVLSDPQKKQEWEMGSQSFNFSGGNPFDIFSSFFHREPPQPKGQSLKLEIVITMREALHGIKKTIKYKRRVICPKCGGKGTSSDSKIEICQGCGGQGRIYKQIGPWQQIDTCPTCYGKGKIIKNPCINCAGEGLAIIEESTEIDIPKMCEPIQLIFNGKGSERVGGIPGDLIVIVQIHSEGFSLAGNGNIIKEIDIDVIDAILGCSTDIKDIEDKTLNVKISPGSKEGNILRVPRKGLPIGNTRGDLHLIIHNIFPKNLTDKQKELLKQFKNDSN